MEQVRAVREFTRFYTRQIGLLNERLYRSPFSLAEVRVLYELAHRESATASQLARELGMDPGYLSRILRRFGSQGLISKIRKRDDARQVLLSISARGRKAFAPLDRRSEEQVSALLRRLAPAEQHRLAAAMRTIQDLLSEKDEGREPFLLRSHRPGDMGWVVYRHGALYAEEYGYDERFEALVAGIVSEFIRNFDPRRERCWIAERRGEIVGFVFLVRKSATVAKLRMLLVESAARGLGLGRRLVEECIRFARQAGYRKITLWTQSELTAARHIYKTAGFKRVRREPFPMLKSTAETWELTLR